MISQTASAASTAAVDHGWIDDGAGILSCVAGDDHTVDRLAVCPYYLRQDVVDRLTRSGFRATGPATVRRHGASYTKITALAGPAHWRQLVAALPTLHGLQTLAWSLFSGLDQSALRDGDALHAGGAVVDPRDAFTAALRHYSAPAGRPDRDGWTTPARAATLLRKVAAAIGDPDNTRGSLGLTGSAGLDLAQLGRGEDIDLVVYPATEPEAVDSALVRSGARFLPELAATGDARAADYLTGRMMPPIADPATARALLGRRRDVAWINDLRIDLTYGIDHARTLPALPYAVPPVSRFTGTATVTAVHPGYPVRFDLDPDPASGPTPDQLIVTARGWQGALQVGDRLLLTADLHQTASRQPPAAHPARTRAGTDIQAEAQRREVRTFVSIDDAAGHALTLLPD